MRYLFRLNAVDGTGRAHIAFYDATQTNLRYAQQAGGSTTWSVPVPCHRFHARPAG
jgi:hypothetical protein